jgi:subtilisin family serine protease
VAGELEVGVELGERLEGEAPLVQARVRNAEARLANRLVAVEEQVEVDRARAEAGAAAHPAEAALDVEEPAEELGRRELRLDLGGRVEEARLVDESDRHGLAERRDAPQLDARLPGEQLERLPERRLAVAEVRAEADECARHSMKVACAVVHATSRADRRAVRVVCRLGVLPLLFALAAGAAHAAPTRKAGSAYLPGPLPSARSLARAPASGNFLIELDRVRAPLAEPLVRAAGGVLLSRDLRLWRAPASGLRPIAARLERAGLVRALEPDRVLQAEAPTVFTDPLFPNEWWRGDVGANAAEAPGPGKPVTVVDSGLDVRHPEFAGRPHTTLLGPQNLLGEDEWHGTAVASVIGAPANGIGLVGVYPDADLAVADASPAGVLLTSAEVAGIAAGARRGPGVINLSLGSDALDFVERDAIYSAVGHGSIVVAAAGNSRSEGNPVTYPASLPHVLTVAATNEQDTVTSFSSSFRAVDLAAPGDDVLAAIALPFVPAGYQPYAYVAGTSFSAPIVAGAAAWLWTRRPELVASQVVEVLRGSARDVGRPGFDVDTGFGIVDIPAALALAAPPPDPGEPNDDVYLVKPNGLSVSGVHPLTGPAQPSAQATARITPAEDPGDVYRVWVPARGSARVTLRGAGAGLELWGPRTSTVFERGGAAKRDLLGVRRPGSARAISFKNRGTRPTIVYANVYLPSGAAAAAQYSLSVATARR